MLLVINIFKGILVFLLLLATVVVATYKKKDSGILLDYVFTLIYFTMILWRW